MPAAITPGQIVFLLIFGARFEAERLSLQA
jgi:hypothetical protein